MNRAQSNRTLLGFLHDEGGATAIEYAIIAAGVASAIAASLVLVGTSVQSMWTTIANAFG